MHPVPAFYAVDESLVARMTIVCLGSRSTAWVMTVIIINEEVNASSRGEFRM
jgi:hypothetical protein